MSRLYWIMGGMYSFGAVVNVLSFVAALVAAQNTSAILYALTFAVNAPTAAIWFALAVRARKQRRKESEPEIVTLPWHN